MVRLGLLLLLAVQLAKTQTVTSFNSELPKAVLEHLNASTSQFDAWTQELSENLSTEEQQQLAWNVRLLDAPKSAVELMELQEKLYPRNDVRNSLKLWLWISYYRELEHSHRLHNDNRLLLQFVTNLRQLRQNSAWPWHKQLQNMLQSFPHSLRTLVTSRLVCLKHNRDQLYQLPSGELLLGANSNCIRWNVQHVEESPNFLRLENACQKQQIWFVNILGTHPRNHSNLLLSEPRDDSLKFCQHQGESYLVEGRFCYAQCLWQLNDCTHLPRSYSRRKSLF